MTAASAAGAASHGSVDWHAIDWPKAHALVRRLQARIVKATQAGRWGKVKALQRLLTHSWSGKVLAVKRVTENPGKHLPSASAFPGSLGYETAFLTECLKGLSGMPGNWHVPF